MAGAAIGLRRRRTCDPSNGVEPQSLDMSCKWWRHFLHSWCNWTPPSHRRLSSRWCFLPRHKIDTFLRTTKGGQSPHVVFCRAQAIAGTCCHCVQAENSWTSWSLAACTLRQANVLQGLTRSGALAWETRLIVLSFFLHENVTTINLLEQWYGFICIDEVRSWQLQDFNWFNTSAKWCRKKALQTPTRDWHQT